MDVLKDILFRFVLALLFVGSIAGVLLGLGMLLRPEKIAVLNKYFSRWVSADKFAEQLDRSRLSERFLYRHHRLVGGAITVGAIFILYIFLFGYNVRRIAAVVPPSYWPLWEALVGALILGSVLAALVGIVVLFRPSLLRDIEKSANRWIATDGIAKYLNSMRYSSDQYLLRSRKIVGVLFIVGSLYVLAVIGSYLWRGAWKLL